MKKQSLDTALVYAEKALQSVKEQVGENDTLYAQMLNSIMEVCFSKGNYTRAAEYCQKESTIRKAIQGEKHPAFAGALNNLGIIYQKMGNYDDAEPLILEAIRIRKEVLGEKNPDYASSLNNLAALYNDIGKYAVAEPLYLESMKIRKEVFGEKHSSYATSINNLALLYISMGNFTDAEHLCLESVKIRKEVYGEKDPRYAISLSTLASLYYREGNYTAAEPYYMEARKISKEVYGEKHLEYVSYTNSLAVVYQAMGNYPAAELLYVEAMKIRKEVLGEKHQSYGVSLSNLAALYQGYGNFAAAESLQVESMKIWKEVYGEKHPNYALSINNLATLYKEMGRYASAQPLMEEAMKIHKEVYGEKHPSYATSLHNIGWLYKDMGKYTEAETFYLEAIKIRKEVLGEKHPEYAISLYNLAELYQAMGNSDKSKEIAAEKYAAAEQLYINTLDIVNANITQNFGFLSETEKEKYFKTQSGKYVGFYSFSLKRKNINPGITQTVFNNVVRNKGLLLKSSTAMRAAINKSNDTALVAQYNQWLDIKRELSKLYSTEMSKRNKDPEVLEQKANVMEKEIVKRSHAFSDFEKIKQLSWEMVKNNLKQDEVAIEFIRFRNNIIDGKSIDVADTIVYCALIVTPKSSQPEMIKLFDEIELEKILGSYSQNNLSYIQSVYGTNQDINDQLYKLVWQPLEKYLAGVKSVYYSPDGLLYKVSFSSIGKGKDAYLCDNYKLVRLSSTGKLAFPETFALDNDFSAGIYGGIDYSSDSTKDVIWQYLPGTKTEAEQIEKIFKAKKVKTNYLSEKSAAEKSFKETAGTNSILHLATHGFFYADPEKTNKQEKVNEEVAESITFRGGENSFGVWQFLKNKNPLMRSGLVFAGANSVWNHRFVGEGEDGVLTAMEVTQLDLSKTQLVTLSACETGLGDIKGSEGVYGLERAFKMAGVKFIIMSLWEVPDKETAEFMTMFYKKLLKTKDIKKSFDETQKEMRTNYDPYFWGAFVLVE